MTGVLLKGVQLLITKDKCISWMNLTWISRIFFWGILYISPGRVPTVFKIFFSRTFHWNRLICPELQDWKVYYFPWPVAKKYTIFQDSDIFHTKSSTTTSTDVTRSRCSPYVMLVNFPRPPCNPLRSFYSTMVGENFEIPSVKWLKLIIISTMIGENFEISK